MLRMFGALLVGTIAGNVWNMGFILLNSMVLFPMPEGMDMMDPDQMQAYMATLPAAAYILVLVAHVGQAGLGGWIAARLGGRGPYVLAGLVGLLTFAGALHNLVVLGGPAFMWLDLPLIVGAAWLAGRAVANRPAGPSGA